MRKAGVRGPGVRGQESGVGGLRSGEKAGIRGYGCWDWNYNIKAA